MQETTTFLQQLFGDIDEKLWFYAWTLQDKRTLWFQDANKAADVLAPLTQESAKKDCYVGVSLASADYGSRVRLKQEEGRTPAGIVGLWADVDFAHGVHKKKSLPPTRTDAQWLVESCGLLPTVMVNSGHGLQPWWLFKEPWTFEKEGEQQRAAKLAETISRFFSSKAAAKRWVIDSVFDLTRVLRLPGTWNHKENEAVQAGIVYADWSRRYEPHDFEHLAVEEATYKPSYVCGEIVLSPDANPPIDKLEHLKENCTEFRRAWDHKISKESPSEYEASIARWAADAHWTDQEIANLIIGHRRRWDPSKIDKVSSRRDYVEGLISFVRGNGERAEALRKITEKVDELPPDPTKETANEPIDESKVEERRKKDVERLSSIFGVNLKRWIQVGRDRPIYTMELQNGQKLQIGSVAAVTDNYKCFARAIYAETGHCMEPISKNVWPGVCETLARICEFVDAVDASNHESVRSGIEDYLRSVDVYSEAQKDVACTEIAPFYTSSNVYVALKPLRKWLNFQEGDRWERQDLINAMHFLGFQRETITYHAGEKKSTRSYYSGPLLTFPCLQLEHSSIARQGQ